MVVSGRDADRLRARREGARSSAAARALGVVADAAKREDVDRLVEATRGALRPPRRPRQQRRHHPRRPPRPHEGRRLGPRAWTTNLRGAS